VLGLSAVILVTGLYEFVVNEYEDDLGRTYPELAQDSYVYDEQGKKIGEIPAAESRETVGRPGFGEHLPQAVVVVEDRRFYEHFGVDFEGLGRAVWTDLRAWEVQEGGGTISEQVMKNLYVPEEERLEISFWRRFVQSSLAFAYEQNYTKEQILTAYLNTVYLGDGAYGTEVAARRFFGKNASALTLSEAATLAGFLHAPSTYTTWESGVALGPTTERRDRVLSLMEEQGMISAADHRAARTVPLKFASDPPPDPAYEPFLEKVRREIAEKLGPEDLALGGFRIHTTLDTGLQRAAVEASNDVLFAPDDPSAAVVTVEPQSGAIRALAGREGSFNLPLDARRQPGSSFKPIVLAAALREKISPESTYVFKELSFTF
jgi:penicillin-binding protein 1A